MSRDRLAAARGERTAGRADSAIEGTPATFERHRASALRSRPVADEGRPRRPPGPSGGGRHDDDDQNAATPALSLVVAGGFIGVVARSRLVHRLRELT